MEEIARLKEEIEKIQQRNKRVEADKAWETSLPRRVAIAITTYILVVIFLTVTKVERPFQAAIIPSVAYLISTASLGMLKDWYLKSKIK